MNLRWLVVALLVLGLSAAVYAQDDAGDFEDIYSEVPTVRGDDGAFIIGAEDAPVTVLEFADFLCPACQRYHSTVQDFIEAYVLTGQARLEYRFFLVIDPELSVLAASVAECSYEQGAFWTVHDELYRLASAREIGADLVSVIAENVGLDEDALGTCVATAEQYLVDMSYGQELSVNSTPSIRARVGDGEVGIFQVNGQDVTGGGVSPDVFDAFIASDSPETLLNFPFSILRDDLFANTSLVDSETCDAPCWEGITPGETSFEDAIAILEGVEGVLRVEMDGLMGEPAVVLFGAETPCCQISTEDGETVTSIVINSAPVVSLGEMLTHYGEPDYHSGSYVSRSQSVHNLWFADFSIIVFAFTAGEDDVLTDESPIIGAIYIAPDLFAETLEQSLLVDGLYAWDGYRAIVDLAVGDS